MEAENPLINMVINAYHIKKYNIHSPTFIKKINFLDSHKNSF